MSNAHERGFTLIELITVIAIIVIILGTLFANFGNFGGTARLEEDVSEVAAMIRSARQDSLSVRQHGTIYPNYGFYVTTDDPGVPSNQIDSQAFVYTDNDVMDTEYRFRRADPGNDVIQDVSLSPGVTVDAVTYKQNGAGAASYDSLSVLFGRSSPVVYISRDNGILLNSGTVEVRLRSSAGEVRTICVNSSGNVRTGFATCL